MPRARDLFASPQLRANLYEGEIAVDATGMDDQVEVIVPAFDKQLKWGPCPWMPRESAIPQKGDRCVVGLAETPGSGMPAPWILAWWPS